MNPAAHRVSLTVLVALAAVAVVAGIVAGTPMLEQHLPSMMAMLSTRLRGIRRLCRARRAPHERDSGKRAQLRLESRIAA